METLQSGMTCEYMFLLGLHTRSTWCIMFCTVYKRKFINEFMASVLFVCLPKRLYCWLEQSVKNTRIIWYGLNDYLQEFNLAIVTLYYEGIQYSRRTVTTVQVMSIKHKIQFTKPPLNTTAWLLPLSLANEHTHTHLSIPSHKYMHTWHEVARVSS